MQVGSGGQPRQSTVCADVVSAVKAQDHRSSYTPADVVTDGAVLRGSLSGLSYGGGVVVGTTPHLGEATAGVPPAPPPGDRHLQTKSSM